MGDKEFESYLNREEENDNNSDDVCPGVFFLDILHEKLRSSASLFKTASELYIHLEDGNIKSRTETFIKKLMENTENAYDQLDFLMSELINDIDEERENNNGH